MITENKCWKIQNQSDAKRKFASKELLITEADNFYKSELDQYNPFRIHSHPFVAACNTLFNCLDAVFKVQSRVTDEEVLGCSEQWYSLLDFTFPNDSDQSRLFMSETFIDSTVEVSPYSYPVYKEVVLTAPGKQFRSMHDFVSEIKQLMLDHCGKCSIETYQMNTTEKRDWGSSALVEHSVNNSTAYDASTTPNFLADIKMKSWLQLKPEVTVTREEKIDFNATTRGSDTVQYKQICFDDYDLSERELVYFDLKGRQLTYKKFFTDTSDVYGISVNGVLIAECCTILDQFSSSEPKMEACCTTGSFIAVIRIDLLSLALLGIDDVRLFWSRDEAYLRSLTDCLMKKLPRNEYPLLPVSYPLCYRHDLCFWVSDIISHDLLLAAIRNCCHDAVHSVKLLRILRHEETQLLSFCYRMIYSRCDGPLSHKETVELQNNLRKVLIDLKFDLR